MNKTVTVGEIAGYLERFAPPALQESYDNAGLLLGSPAQQVNAVLVTLDVTEAVVEEAIRLNAGLIVAHHPLIFSGLRRITGSNPVERIVEQAIRNNIAVYAAHTNLDSVSGGVNFKMAEKLGLGNCRILQPAAGMLRKLVTFAPVAEAEKVRLAIFEAGAGHIGNYDQCSFNVEGNGTFRGGEAANPFVGQKGKLHTEPEVRIETIFPKYLEKQLIRALLEAHPYEEVAWDIYPLENRFDQAGAGVVGTLPRPVDENQFLTLLKEVFRCPVIRHTPLRGQPVQKIALCGGAGSFLLKDALSAGADFFVSGDFKYHQFFDADGKIVIADVGHFESEQFTKELFYELLTKKFSTFAVHLSEVNTNPVNYF